MLRIGGLSPRVATSFFSNLPTFSSGYRAWLPEFCQTFSGSPLDRVSHDRFCGSRELSERGHRVLSRYDLVDRRRPQILSTLARKFGDVFYLHVQAALGRG